MKVVTREDARRAKRGHTRAYAEAFLAFESLKLLFFAACASGWSTADAERIFGLSQAAASVCDVPSEEVSIDEAMATLAEWNAAAVALMAAEEHRLALLETMSGSADWTVTDALAELGISDRDLAQRYVTTGARGKNAPSRTWETRDEGAAVDSDRPLEAAGGGQ